MVENILTEDQMTQMYDRAIRFAREECPTSGCPIESELIACVQESVRIESEGKSILTYVPILAMRRVRQCMTAGSCEFSTQGATA